MTDVAVVEVVAQAVLAILFVLIGGLLVVRVPDNRVSWAMATTGAALVLMVLQGLAPREGWLAVVAGWTGSWVWLVSLALPATLVLLWFPDGSVPRPGWRWVERALVTAFAVVIVTGVLLPFDVTESADVANPIAPTSAAAALGAVYEVAIVTVPLLAIVCAASLVGRYRRSSGVERQQLRLLALGGSVALASYVLGDLLTRLPGITWPLITYGGLVVIAVAIAVAVLKYRLYDLDRLVSRTVSWTVLTAVLVGVYAGIVVGTQAVLGLDRAPDLVVAGSTLAVAALFRPVRRRVQDAVDHRFNRRRTDAAHAVAAFATRVRDEVDVDLLVGDVVATAGTTMQPRAVRLWLAGEPA